MLRKRRFFVYIHGIVMRKQIDVMYEKINLKKELKTFFMLFFGGVALGFLLMIGCYALPTERISAHVAQSAAIFEKEGTYPEMFQWCTSRRDNWTDAVMLLNAAYPEEDYSLIDRAMNVYRVYEKDVTPAERLVLHYSGEAEKEESRGYGRYWHGYLIFLKPLLLVLSYDKIRMLNLFLQSVLTGVLLYILYKKNLGSYILPYVFMILFLMPLTIAFSMQFATVFYLFTIVSIILVLKFDYLIINRNDFYFFMLTGMATSYFDFLTYPVATLGIPLVFYTLLQKEKWKNGARYRIVKIIWLSIGWGIGYLGMWVSKWFIGTALTSENMIWNALGSVKYRSTYGAIDQKISIVQMLLKNGGAFFYTPFTVGAAAYIVICSGIIIKNRRWRKEQIITGIPLIMIGLMPFAWWIAACNHSWDHYWFTNKSMCVSLFSILCLFRQSCGGIKELNSKKADNKNETAQAPGQIFNSISFG